MIWSDINKLAVKLWCLSENDNKSNQKTNESVRKYVQSGKTLRRKPGKAKEYCRNRKKENENCNWIKGAGNYGVWQSVMESVQSITDVVYIYLSSTISIWKICSGLQLGKNGLFSDQVGSGLTTLD